MQESLPPKKGYLAGVILFVPHEYYRFLLLVSGVFFGMVNTQDVKYRTPTHNCG